MKISIITAFPTMFAPLRESIVKRASEKDAIELNIVDLKEFGSTKWNKIDDRPFGGGAGMLIQVEPIYKAISNLNIEPERERREASTSLSLTTKVILTSARGKSWHQSSVEKYRDEIEHLVIICGHYEGIDYRVVEYIVDEEISIGNFVLSGGELAAMVITDSIVRLLPEVLGNEESAEDETQFLEDGSKIAEYPQYTRPEVFETKSGGKWDVPKVLLSGNHGEIEKWKNGRRLTITN